MKLAGIIRLYKENGMFLTLALIKNRIIVKIYSVLLRKQLRAGWGLYVHPSAHIGGASNITIGNSFYAAKDLWLEAITFHNGRAFNPKIIIKNNVAVNDYVHIAATNYIEIGNNVLMASKIYISDHNHGVYRGDNQTSPEIPPNMRMLTNDMRVIIGDNVWIGEFVSILPGAMIGKGSIIGSNSVVTGEIPPYSIAVGTPARVVKQYDFASSSWVSCG